MNEKLRNAFGQVRMSPECTEKIQTALAQPQPAGGYTAMHVRESRRSRFMTIAAMACLLAVVIFAGTVMRGGEAPAQMTDTTDPEMPTETLDVTMEYEDIQTRVEANVRIRQHSNGDFLYPSGEKLYFSTNGENIDITDRISNDEPFTYVYTDEAGFIHYIAVGGCYTPGSNSLEGVYFGYWYRDAANADQRYSGWIGGNSAGHWCNATNDYFGWYTKACEILDIPWQPHHNAHHDHE